MKKNIFLITFALILLTACSSNKKPEDPAQFMRKIFRTYAPGSEAVSYYETGEKRILTDSLLKIITENDKAHEGEVGYLNGDPICDCQDYGTIRIKKIEVLSNDDKNAEVVAEFYLFEGNREERNIKYQLIAENGLWYIDNIISSTEKVSSLKEAIQEDTQRTKNQ